MAITYPRADLHDLTALDTVFRLVARSETSRAASGVTVVKELGPPLWMAEFSTPALTAAAAARVAAWLDSLDNGVRTFTAYDVRQQTPAAAPADLSALLGAKIASVSDGALALKGLPSGFVLSPGDRLAFAWGAGGARRAYHRVAEAATADANGDTPAFEVRPHVRGTPVADTVVGLIRPRAVWRLDPESVREETVQTFHTRFSWTATQAP